MPLLQVKDLSVQLSGRNVLGGVSFSIHTGENLAVIGLSGSGKSTLIKALAGKQSGKGTVVFTAEKKRSPRIVTIAQQHSFKNLSNTASFYYQQRFNSGDADDAIMVNDALLLTGADETALNETLALLGIAHIRFTRLIQLSNGEHKRFQLAKAILQKADWLLLDNPYTGLDTAARNLLNTILDTLAGKGIHILLVTSFTEIPASITHVAVLENGHMQSVITRSAFENLRKKITAAWQVQPVHNRVFDTVMPAYAYDDFSVAIKMVGTNVVYNNRKILDNINWEVKKGECWHVSGHNGSGKSTLLSLVNGDNPQAFANEIYLFDRKKGSGESIWDIKQKIGYISPELHHYFDASDGCYQVVASGLFDTIGLFRKPGDKQKKIVDHWMSLLGITQFSNRLFSQLSNGEQRLVLLARALVKNPPLLILDEPCQGLDRETAVQFIALINDICVQLKKTLVYVSHYEEEIPACVTYTLQLKQGKKAA